MSKNVNNDVSKDPPTAKGSDDIFHTKNLNLVDVSSFNLLLRIVESRSTVSNKFSLCCSFIQLLTCRA